MKKYLFAILLLLAGQIFADENRFENKSAGLSLDKPASWHYLSAQQNLDNLKNMRLSDEEMRQRMLKNSSVPLVAMTKYAEPYEDVNPSFKVNIKPMGQLKGTDPKKILELFVPVFEKTFKDFALEQKPVDSKISGFDAAYMRINYTLETGEGLEFPTTSELWIVPRGDFFFMIGAGTRQDEKTGTRQEIQEIVKTIKIEP